MKNVLIKSIGIVVSLRNEKAIEIAKHIVDFFIENGVDISFYPHKLKKEIDSKRVHYVNSIKDVKGDIIITIGGDGTVLRTFLYVKDKETPVVGIGLGERNFLSSLTPDNYSKGLSRILEGRFYLRREMRLNVEIEGLTYTLPPVLNDVLFATGTPGKTIDAYVGIRDGNKKEILWNCKADGVLISTPVGSTAYAFAAGGPVVDTDLEAMLIVPLLPVARKPIYIIDPSSEVQAWASEKRSKPIVVLDGQITIELEHNQIVKVKHSNMPAYLVTFDKNVNLIRLKKAAENA